MKISITTKLILLTTILVAMTALTVSTYLYQESAKQLVQLALADLTKDVSREGEKIRARLSTLKENVLFLANAPSIKNLGLAAPSQRRAQENQLSDIFKSIALGSKDIYQVRLLDHAGNERIKFERNQKGLLNKVPANQLQNKAHRNYVRNSLKLKEGETSLSDINLNREFGKVTLPHTLVLRVATPIYNKNKLLGLIIINIDFGQQIKRIENTYRDKNKVLFITSHDGTFLSHPDKSRLYGNDLGYRYRIQELYPHLATLFAPGNTETSRTYIPNETSGKVKVFVKIPLSKPQTEHFITIGLTQDYQNIVATATSNLQDSLWIVALLVLTGIMLAFGFASLLTTPLRQILYGMDRLLGDEDYQLSVKSDDEIGKLATMLNSMSRNVRSSRHALQTLNAHLEEEVDERTRELHLNLQLVNSINYAQTSFINETDHKHAFEIILNGLLDITGSEFGLVGEILQDENNASYMKTLVMSDHAWSEATRKQHEEDQQDRMLFATENNPIGTILSTRQAVISNTPTTESEAHNLAAGCPEIKNYLGLPVFNAEQLVGIVLVANRKSDYHEPLIQLLQPFLTTCVHMIASLQARRDARQKNIELKNAKDDLDRAIGSSKVVFYTSRASGDFGATFISENVSQQLGYTPEDFVNDPGFWAAHIHPDDREHVFNNIGTVFEHGEHSHSYRFLDKQGNYRWMLDELQLHYDADGNPHELSGFWTDITERKKAELQLQESESRFRRMADGAPALIWLSDDENNGIWFNKRWLDYTGRTLEQECGTGWTEGIHLDDLQTAVDYCIERFDQRRPFEMEFRLRKADGSYGWIVDTGIPRFTESGEFEGYIGYCWDISDRKLAEQALLESEEKFRSIITSSPMGVFIYELNDNDDLIFMDHNPAANKILEIDCQQFVGLTIEEAFPDLAKTDIPKRYREAASAGIPWDTEDLFYDDNQNIAGAFDVHAFQTSPNKLAVMFLDVTERLQFRDELMHFKTTLDLTGDCVFMFYPDNLNIFYVNNGTILLTGYTHEELIKQQPHELFPELNSDDFQHMVSQLIEQKSDSQLIETCLQDKNKNLIDMEIHLQYIHPSGETDRFVAIMRDISERKKLDRIKNEFISTVSHELRTPLTSIRGALGLLNGGKMGEVSAKAKKMLDIANNNSDRLLLLINDILDIQRIESNALSFNFKPVPVMPIIEKAMQEFSAYAVQYNIKYALTQTADNTVISADEDRLMQVLGNLMSNAVKFSNSGDTVELAVIPHHNYVRISVIDYGPGIPKAFHNKLFDRFTQWDASDSRQKGGTGLGLSIAKAIVEKHNGSINFTTREGVGTTMYIDLPIQNSGASVNK